MLGRVTIALFFLLLVWGNLVAGMKAGLGCPDWPLCHGRVVPPYRWDIYMEFGHRVIAATATLCLAALSYRRFRDYEGFAKAIPMAAVLLVAAEVVMGGLVVILELPVKLTTFHFITGVMVYALVFYMGLTCGKGVRPSFPVTGVYSVYLGLAALVFLQAALGAFVRHSGAGLACPDFPYCMGGLVPPVLTPTVLAQFSHRMFAYMLLFTVIANFAFTSVFPGQGINAGLAKLLVALTVLQVAVGGAVVLTGLYYPLTALHLGVAVTMLSVALLMWLRQTRQREAVS